jgi:CMP-N,N'-diacetyllegionaminic acid synthase
MDVVALIPARGGSKGIPRKNLADVAGKPLLAWTVAAAQASRTVTRVVVSTEDAEIAEVAQSLGAEVLDRPAELAADDTPMLDVVRHALGELGPADVLVVLQPTSPLRRAEHIDAAVELLAGSDADSVVSIVEVPHRFEPGSLMSVEGDRLARLGESTPRRQEKPALWARNGPAVLAVRADRVADDLYGGNCRPYVMEPRDSLDVDDAFDLELASLLLAPARTV